MARQPVAAAPPGMAGDGVAGMSKNQLYDIMSQMKVLVEQNHEQARGILVKNPMLTRALFQAQIMLGMVRTPQVMPNIQQALSQPQIASTGPSVQSTQTLPAQSALQGQASSSQPPVQARQQQPQSSISLPPASVPQLNFQSQTMPVNSPYSGHQAKGFPDAPVPSISHPQSSQIHNLPLPPPPPHYSMLQSHMLTGSGQAQQPVQNPGMLQPLQPPLPMHPRPPSWQPYSHQHHSQVSQGLSYQPSTAPQSLLSHPMFHSGNNPPSSFPRGQPPLPSQPPPQQFFQGGSHIGSDFSPVGTSMQADRGASWAPVQPERPSFGVQLPGPPPLLPGHMAPGVPGGQPARPPPLTPDMEQALLQQVMSLTPEQINLLPPEQRSQVIQLQEMLSMVRK